jgi:hypothetical protein
LQPNASSFLAPQSQLLNGETYRWRVRCGCTNSIIGAWSAFDLFSWNIPTKSLNGSDAALSLYPNPANTELNVTLTLDKGGMYTVAFFDLQGRMVKEKLVNVEPNQNLRFDISDLESGVYLFQVSNGINTFTEKLIKQ